MLQRKEITNVKFPKPSGVTKIKTRSDKIIVKSMVGSTKACILGYFFNIAQSEQSRDRRVAVCDCCWRTPTRAR